MDPQQIVCGCGGSHKDHPENRKQHENTRRHRLWAGIPVPPRTKMECACGGEYSSNECQHKRTKRHQRWEAIVRSCGLDPEVMKEAM
jgi:hypothetical protein